MNESFKITCVFRIRAPNTILFRYDFYQQLVVPCVLNSWTTIAVVIEEWLRDKFDVIVKLPRASSND